ncbi:unnamed protein product (mitochondrion) [Plasmodiophora brassicae]|uniref:Uncharacterized protein n=1 Tax=Plasmodiophora brassicae TaxID=37360 RepID=A0A3P3YKD9_PLABS|nr:unnamed protein product [Plasmodiophora brassicae]
MDKRLPILGRRHGHGPRVRRRLRIRLCTCPHFVPATSRCDFRSHRYPPSQTFHGQYCQRGALASSTRTAQRHG